MFNFFNFVSLFITKTTTMKKKLSFLFFIILTLGLNAQDAPLGEAEKNAIKASNPFSSVYPTSILKSSDQYFASQMELFSKGAINEKNAHLIALGTSAATKCDYCIPYHISEAKRLGATDEEIKTAVLIAADVMRMSTLFYGNEFDLEAFKAMLK